MADREGGRRRSGGRAGRIAARQAPLEVDVRPVRPGLPGGKLAPLSESDMQQVYDAALALLEDVGMGSPIEEFIDVVTAAGGHVDDAERLHYPKGVVEGAIATAAKEWVWHGFDDDRSITVGGDRVHFGTAGAAVLMYDHEMATFRPSTAVDVYDCARLVDALDHIHFFVRTVVARDMEDARLLDLNTAYAAMAGTTKPIGTSWFEREHVYETVNMFDMALGGPGEFRKRPFVAANNTFVVPPLRFAEESARAMVAQVETGMPINLLSAGQAGATSPAALAGSLAQALAECLAALTGVNLLNPGHPCVMGMWPFVSDLRTGAMSGGSGEEGILNAAAAQLLNWIGLPSGVAAGMADSKIPDNQAGYEKGINVALAGQAGANLVYESAGMLARILSCSLEALVIDHDMLGSINRTRTGLEVNQETPAALAGSLAQALAECLAALTGVNLLNPGHPCVMGMWPFVSDLRTGAMSGGSGEEGILNAAAAQLLNWIGLPSGVAAGMADSKIPDNQAGYEKGINVALAGQAGANLVYESAGMLASILSCSLEALVIDNDMLGSINRTVRGIEVNEETLSAQLIADVIAGPGHFLGSPQTLELMQREYVYPEIGDRDTPDNWLDAGGKDARDRAHEYVQRVLAEHRPSHIAPDVDARIRAAFPIHLP